MMNNKPLAAIDQLLRDGLARDPQQINWYRQILQNPRDSFNNTIYRGIAGDVFDTLLNYVLNDAVLFNRLRQLLLSDRLDRRAYESIIRKSVENGVSADILLEVYRRGTDQESPAHLSREQRGFNRLNSFLAHGRAWYEDYDLIEMRLNPAERETGTDSLLASYQEDTPGERKTISTIRRVKNGK